MTKLRLTATLGCLIVSLFLLGCETGDDDSGGNGSSLCRDADGDGFYTGKCDANYLKVNDCNDDDPAVNPGEQEICGNQKDEDCDGEDVSGDGEPCDDCGQVCYLIFGPVCVDDGEGGYCYEGNDCFANAKCEPILCHLDLKPSTGNIDPNSECAQVHPGCVDACPEQDPGDDGGGDSEPGFPGEGP